jgi:hypothetical protein
VPKLGQGSCYPGWLLERRRRAERALAAVVAASCLLGVSTRRVEKLAASREPAVLVICDELAVVIGQNMGGSAYGQGPTNFQLGTKLKRMTVIGRSEAIDPVLATQRGTVTMTGDGDLESPCDLRIGLGVATEADARLVIPDDMIVAADLARLTEPGSGIIWRKNDRCAPFKVYRCEPEDIAEVYRRAHVLRPAPDQRLAEALGDVYEERWTHRGQYLLPGGGRPAAGVVAPPGMDADEFRRIVDSSLSDIDVPVSDMPGDDTASPARKRMCTYMQRMGATRVAVGGIVTLLESEKMPVSESTVHRWLSELAAAGLAEQTGKYGYWKWRQQ